MDPTVEMQVRSDVRVHPSVIVHEGVVLGPQSTVEPFCVLGSEDGRTLEIGKGAVIRSHSIIEGGSDYGPGLETGHHVLLRSGNSVGLNLRIGSYSSLEGGADIGNYVRIHGRCEMTKGAIGHFARVYGGTYITDQRQPPAPREQAQECLLEPGCVVAMGCVLVAGITIGMGAYVGAGIVVGEDVPPVHLLRGDGSLKRIRHDRLWPFRYGFEQDYPPESHVQLGLLREEMFSAATGMVR